jgi:hypothetical protein
MAHKPGPAASTPAPGAHRGDVDDWAFVAVGGVADATHRHWCGRGGRRTAMATLRNLALGILRLAGITQIKRTLERIAADRMRIFPIIATAVHAI